MLKKRIIPVVLFRGWQAVKARQFKADRNIGFVRQQVMIHERRQSDEIFLLDIEATPKSREPNWELLADLTASCMTPICIGGGIRTLEHIRLALQNGADKVAICTRAFQDPYFIERAAQKFGSQAIVASIDVRNGWVVDRCGSGAEGARPLVYVQLMAALGAGEILLNCVERDGTMQGYDLALIERVASSVSIPVIACGGAGTYDHMYDAFQVGAHGVAASAMWSFLDQTQTDAARYLAGRGVPVRLHEAV